MTIEEAIDLLKMELGCRSKDMEKCFEVYGLECKGCGYYVDYDVLTEAIKTAIEALEAQPKSCEYAVNALAVEEMLKDLLPERGMWEIKGDEAKTAICEVVRSALEGLWKLPFVKSDSKESSSTHKALDNNLPSALPEQQWIPCSERLPDKEGQYLVTDEAGGVVSIICDVFFHYDDGAPTWLLSQNVKAWMELPEAYREGEG